jgi:hypothetical protein
MTMTHSNRNVGTLEMTYEYHVMPGSESIYGSKDELQALGLAEGRLFPGEPGGPKRKLSVTDPRGFPCTIARSPGGGEGRFYAFIRTSEIEAPPALPRHDAGHGVGLCCPTWGDLYEGPADGLMALGLIGPEHLPEPVGSGNARVVVQPDGQILRNLQRRTVETPPGTMVVSRLQKPGWLQVAMHVSREEEERRHDAKRAAWVDYHARMRAVPRPAPLVPKARRDEAEQRRAGIHLVWSKPPFMPTLALPR